MNAEMWAWNNNYDLIIIFDERITLKFHSAKSLNIDLVKIQVTRCWYRQNPLLCIRESNFRNDITCLLHLNLGIVM